MKHYKSVIALFVIGIVYLLSIYHFKPYKWFYDQYEGDAPGYYVYLPAFFIYHDLHDLKTTTAAKYTHVQPGRKADGDYQNKYFAGTAVLQAPFFLAAHALAPYFHQPRDGFSMIYMQVVDLSVFVYTMLALFILSLFLRRRFSDGVTALVILILALGTNLYYLVTAQPPLSHPYLFFWYVLLVVFTDRFYATRGSRYIYLIGWVCGMIILTRMNELYALIIPMVWGIRSRADLMERVKLAREVWVPITAAGVIMFLCLLPQMLYWKISSGHFLYYSYKGEYFDFLHPHIFSGLFGFANGWLIYSPIMILAIAGIVFAFRRREIASMAILVFLLVHIYVIYSWWCYWYMGSYGSRPMTEAYAILSIPLAYTIEWFYTSWFKRIVLVVVTTFCIWLVLLQTYQIYLNIFYSELGNWRFNLMAIGKTKFSYEESIVLNTEEYQPRKPIFVKKLMENDFEGAWLPISDSSVSVSGHRAICVYKDSGYTAYTEKLQNIGAKKGEWIKASMNCLAKEPTDHFYHLSFCVIAFQKGNKIVKWNQLGLQNKINNPKRKIWYFPLNEWGNVYFYSRVPSDADSVTVFIQHTTGPNVYIDDFKLELFEQK